MLEFTMVMASYINSGSHSPWQQGEVTGGNGHLYCDVPSHSSGEIYMSTSVQVWNIHATCIEHVSKFDGAGTVCGVAHSIKLEQMQKKWKNLIDSDANISEI